MMKSVRPWLAPAYLFACLLLGGSSLGVWSNAILQLLAIAILWVAWPGSSGVGIGRKERQLWILTATLLLWIVVQLVPLPPIIWQQLPGRSMIVEGDRLLGLGDVWRPISLSPPHTLAGLSTLLVPVAMLAAVIRLGGGSGTRLAVAVAGAAILGLTLGFIQLSGGADWYLYPRSNVGVATGFFANGNHMAALLLCLLPLAAAIAEQASIASADRQRYWAIAGLAAGLALLAMVGLLFNRSLFGMAMMMPVTLVSIAVALRHMIGRRVRVILLTVAAAVMTAAIAAGYSYFQRHGDKEIGVSIATRIDIAGNSATLASRFFPVGSGAGTFMQVYPLTERADSVDRFFVNHAHNDYLEWLVESGLPGLIILVLFLLWWGNCLGSMIADKRATGFAHAGAIICVILLLHSTVDFPLRTPAMAALFAASVGMMMNSRRMPRQRKDLRAARHVTIE